MTGLAEVLLKHRRLTVNLYDLTGECSCGAKVGDVHDHVAHQESVILAWIAERLADPEALRPVRNHHFRPYDGPALGPVWSCSCGVLFQHVMAEVRRVLGVQT